MNGPFSPFGFAVIEFQKMDDKKESSPSKDVDLRSLVTKSASSGNVTFAISAVDVPKEQRKGGMNHLLKNTS